MHIGSWNTTPPPPKKAKKYLEIMMFSLSKDYIKKTKTDRGCSAFNSLTKN